MKQFISLSLALILALTAFIVPALAEDRPIMKIGSLTMLNMTEEELANYMRARLLTEQELSKQDSVVTALDAAWTFNLLLSFQFQPVYYDTLDAMVMALQVDDVRALLIYSKTADYLCANNDQLMRGGAYQNMTESGAYAELVYNTLLSNDFAFMMLEGQEALRDEFDKAIAAVKADGTLDRLAAEHIDAAIAGQDIAPVEMPVIEGAETIKVAVTGSLPPMDYIAPDGSPAGFNTALLSEISQRIGKNIELVVVDSIGRAAALASGTVDVVFWTRTNGKALAYAATSDAEKEKARAAADALVTEEQVAVIMEVANLINLADVGKMDMPEGTIITDAYYSDYLIQVLTSERMEIERARML